MDGSSPRGVNEVWVTAEALPRFSTVHHAAPRRGMSGFTLFELLVTIAIVAIMISLAVLSIGDNRQDHVRRVAEQITALLQLAQEQALFNGEELGVEFSTEGYDFFQLHEGRWQPLTSDPHLRPRPLPADVTLTLYLEGLEVDLEAPRPLPEARPRKGPEDEEEDDIPERIPHILILSDGTMTPFEVEFGDGIDTELRLETDPLGRTKIEVVEN